MTLQQEVLLFGGSFDPPGRHHEQIVKHFAMLTLFAEIRVIPCGVERTDKAIHTLPEHRLALCQQAFGSIPNVTIDAYDLQHACFTPVIDVHARYVAQGFRPIHAIGSDLLQGDAQDIRHWKEGERVWRELPFVLLERPGYPLRDACRPPGIELTLDLQEEAAAASRDIRTAIATGGTWQHLVSPGVTNYLLAHNLYQKGHTAV